MSKFEQEKAIIPQERIVGSYRDKYASKSL